MSQKTEKKSLYYVTVPVQATMTYPVFAEDDRQAKAYVRTVIQGEDFTNTAWNNVKDPVFRSYRSKTALEHFKEWSASRNGGFEVSTLWSSVTRALHLVKVLMLKEGHGTEVDAFDADEARITQSIINDMDRMVAR